MEVSEGSHPIPLEAPEVVLEEESSCLKNYPDTNYPDIIYFDRGELLDRLTGNNGIILEDTTSKEILTELIKILMEFEIFEDGYEIELEQNIYNQLITLFSDLLCEKKFIISKEDIPQTKRIEVFNTLIDKLSIMDFTNKFISFYRELYLSEEIKNPKAHLKACLWNKMRNYELEKMKLQAFIYELEGKYES